MASEGRVIYLEDGWGQLEDFLNNLEAALAVSGGATDEVVAALGGQAGLLKSYDVCYAMCTQRSPYNWSEQLYTRVRQRLEEYYSTTVVPAVQGKQGEALLEELCGRWEAHGAMAHCVINVFGYLDRYHVKHHNLTAIEELITSQFHDYVFAPVRTDAEAAVHAVVRAWAASPAADKEAHARLLSRCVAMVEKVSGNRATPMLMQSAVECDISAKDFDRLQQQVLGQSATGGGSGGGGGDGGSLSVHVAAAEVRLVSSDGEGFSLSREAALLSGLVEGIVGRRAATAPEAEVALPGVKAPVLSKVTEFCAHYVEEPMREIEKPLTSAVMADLVQPWYAAFVDVEQEALFEVILAANYMDVKPLLDLACATVASMIKGKTPEEIRKTFNIVNDFTPEEEAQVREENKWVEEA